ncbi:ABC-type transport system ATP-binding protein (probable substrate phosphate/phosphonate) [Natrialba magadii ATCC 43099]|uniref:ABC transporter n=1 Tax=Natrialba magadii (strain ATCC 43099 / DSM 3394 / CCM 3739 / CIP 104546 / IAM 13178 / JCM 8861 / NBRC 102185 / NCIMB 2190 / MS3) TaxID=547559 RepID=D3SUK1_NATMM|nr:phosphonate ABC transporter ATP-binding protein [Natrialba magadii]ADD05259.1 ABC-type transport system ATP-binding protein (probable substrate phosphate/phosphonate) [Natrialba magadii ATCC 43099]ELY29019.1 ABC transporter [Natrialba magadii ATCC 43099]
MSKIVVDNLRKTYGDTVALDNISFEVPAGEFVIILGVSGSGKSTLLRCMSALTEPTAGQVLIDGEPMTSTQPEVAMIFQQHNIIGDMSAYSNALSGGINRTGFLESIFQLQDDEEKQQALEALDTVGLLEEAEKKSRRMSGGQQQRVGIARALTQEPDVLLADEPVASLDPGSAQDVMGYLNRAADERNLTTFISLHQVNIARKYGQRFIGLHDGQKVFDGYREDLTLDVIDEIYGDIDTEGMFVSHGENSSDRGSADNQTSLDREATL